MCRLFPRMRADMEANSQSSCKKRIVWVDGICYRCRVCDSKMTDTSCFSATSQFLFSTTLKFLWTKRMYVEVKLTLERKRCIVSVFRYTQKYECRFVISSWTPECLKSKMMYDPSFKMTLSEKRNFCIEKIKFHEKLNIRKYYTSAKKKTVTK